MIEGYEKFRLSDEGKNNEFFVEVNWDEKNDKTNKCQILKFTFPDGTESFIRREYLNAMLFAISSEEDQRKMIPQTITKVRWHETVVGVKATKDIAKGEQVVFPIKLSCQFVQENEVGRVKHKQISA